MACFRAAPQQRLLRFADGRNRQNELRRSRKVASDDLDALLVRGRRELIDQFVRVDPLRNTERGDREQRARTHRGEIGEIHSEALPRDEVNRNRTREVDIFDEHVVRDDLLADHRGIVAGAREMLPDPFDQIGFFHRRGTGTRGSSGRSNRSREYRMASRKSPDGGAVG
jgi:hypothetical protein